jgi:hypothetical protein
VDVINLNKPSYKYEIVLYLEYASYPNSTSGQQSDCTAGVYQVNDSSEFIL